MRLSRLGFICAAVLSSSCIRERESDPTPRPPFPASPLPGRAIPDTPCEAAASPLDEAPSDFDGGPDAGRPNFEVATTTGVVRVPQGGSIDVPVTVARGPEFDEPVEVEIIGLPEGVSATSLTLASGTSSGAITLSAPKTVGIPWVDQARVRGFASTGTSSAPLGVQVRGAAGTIDTSFGTDGSAGLPFFYEVLDAEEQPDGKLLVTGYEDISQVVLCRLLLDGSLDAAFGNDRGCARLEIEGYGAAIAASGNGIILAAFGYDGFLLIRFFDDGSLDPAFGVSGITHFSYPVALHPTALLATAQAIMVAGWSSSGVNFVARFDARGAVDWNFGDDGIFSFGGSEFADLVPYDDCGVSVVGGGYVIAFDRSGALREDFAADGVLSLPFSVSSAIRLPTDELLTVEEDGMALARISGTGEITATYGDIEPPPEAEWVYSRARHAQRSLDGAVVIAGSVYNADGTVLAVARRLSSGEPDDMFGSGGVTWTGSGSAAFDVETLRDARYLVVGTREDSSRAPILRYWN